jgi:site-specific recombinase XerD
MLAALRGTLRAAWRLGVMSSDDYNHAADVKAVTGETLPAGRELGGGELSALIETCQADKNSNSGTRDAAILAVMAAGGLRRAEVVNLDLAHFSQDETKLTFTGKRKKQRTAKLTNGAARAMSDWLAIRGSDEGPLFLAINKSDKVRPAARLTSQAVYNMLKRRAAAAGVAHFSPHDLRRTYVSDLLEAGADIATVAKMAGHSNVQTTARYDRRPEQAKDKAAELLHFPYKSKAA